LDVDGAVAQLPSTSSRKPPIWMQRRSNFADKELTLVVH
jgi:hypothetical protein